LTGTGRKDEEEMKRMRGRGRQIKKDGKRKKEEE